MISFARRNLLNFFRDRSTVFFSFLTSLIIIALYVLFLGDVYTEDYAELAGARELMDNWVMAGILATTSVSTTIGAFAIMVNDRASKISKDFYSSPVSRPALAGGYILAAFAIGIIMSLITLVLAEVYIVAQGGALMSTQTLIKVLGLLLLVTLCNTSMVFFFTSFFESNNAFSTAGTVVGTLLGFVTGIYLPIGMLPEAVQWVIKLFPTSHGAALLRQVMMEQSITESMGAVPAEYIQGLKTSLGVTFDFGGTTLSSGANICILVGFALVFFVIAVINISRKKK